MSSPVRLEQNGVAAVALLVLATLIPFVGGITATAWQGGEEVTLGRVESAVYTRRRVEIPLPKIPESGRVLLEFDTAYGSIPADSEDFSADEDTVPDEPDDEGA